jgi:hypothetical protein
MTKGYKSSIWTSHSQSLYNTFIFGFLVLFSSILLFLYLVLIKLALNISSCTICNFPAITRTDKVHLHIYIFSYIYYIYNGVQYTLFFKYFILCRRILVLNSRGLLQYLYWQSDTVTSRLDLSIAVHTPYKIYTLSKH